MVIFSAFTIALIASLMFAPFRKGSLISLAILFLILFMAAVSSQYWMRPVGPSYLGVNLIPMILTVFVSLLLLMAPSPSRINHIKNIESNKDVIIKEEKIDHAPTEVIGLFTWIIFIILFIIAATGFYNSAV